MLLKLFSHWLEGKMVMWSIGQTILGWGKGEEQKIDLFGDRRDCICFRDLERGNMLVWMSRLHERSQD